MARVKSNLSTQIPSMQNWGGIRSIQKRLERSATIMENKEAVAYSLLCMANTKITDIMEWDEAGQIKVKASKDIPEHALQAIRSIKVNKDGNLELELYDKVGVLRLLAKASGLLDSPEDSDKPSVIGINIKPPDIEDIEIK
jgi:formylmethanofuran:tetrahydromethanopterin formyltransferase